jgi:hypothetical protein
MNQLPITPGALVGSFTNAIPINDGEYAAAQKVSNLTNY